MSEEYKGDMEFSDVVNKVVSEGGADAESITKLIKSGGEVVGYELESGKHISVHQAIEMAKANQLKHVGISISKGGNEYIRSLADGDESNNLGNLPSITADYR
ncbi:MAG: DUF3892 domain-containing protein [Cellulosilyticum sp.]|nr:DUF3892 domain-containing protein [Cellulosilyticum sp.]